MEAVDLITRLRNRLPGHDMHLHGPAPDPAPPLDPTLVPQIEARLGFALPPLLIRVLTEIGNGGFGPGYGLMGLGAGGFADDMGQTADGLYLSFRKPDPATPAWSWPEGLLPICHFGCAAYHCLDADSLKMRIWEPNLWDDRQPIETAIFDAETPLLEWLGAWADGKVITMFRTDPPLSPLAIHRTRKPRRSGARNKDQQTGLDKL